MNWRRVKTLAVKEVRELSREKVVLFGMILGPILIFGFLSVVMSASMGNLAEEAQRPVRVAIVWTGPGDPPGILKDIARELDAPILSEAPTGGYEAVVYVGPGFAENITRGTPARVRIVYYLDKATFVSIQKAGTIEEALSTAVLQALTPTIRQCLPNATSGFLQDPVSAEVELYYRGRQASVESMMALVASVSIVVPMATIILAFSSMIVSALSIGAEKEARTLETLLTLPVSRTELVTGKMMGVSLLILAGLASYGAGLYMYMESISKATGGEAPGLTLTATPQALAVIIVALAASMIAASLLGLIIGTLVSDIRGAQMAASYTGLILLLPVFALMLGTDPTTLDPLTKAVLGIDPFMLLLYTSTYALLGELSSAIPPLTGIIIESIALALIASRLLTGEHLIAGIPRLRGLTTRLARK